MSVFVFHPGTGTVMALQDVELVSVDDEDDIEFSESPDDYLINDRIPGYDAIGYLAGYFIDEGGEG